MLAYLVGEKAQFKGVFPHLVRELGCQVTVIYSLHELHDSKYRFFVSDRYSDLIPQDLCEAFEGRCVNLHASILPLNRGSYPIVHALARKEPVGYTIHAVAPKVDSGKIVWQEKVDPDFNSDTLFSLWYRVQLLMLARAAFLCHKLYNGVRVETSTVDVSRYVPSFHYRASLSDVSQHMTHGWDTKISEFCENMSQI
jgi:hypothetical protein